MVPNAAPYVALLAVLLLALSVRVISERGRAKVSLGDGGDVKLRRAIRAQANCAEYAPLGAALILVCELNGGSGWLVHLLGLALVAGRVLHAVSVSRDPEPIRLRVAGMILTFAALGLGALAAAAGALFA